MDIAESLNYSVIGFGELLNSSNTTTEPTSVEETFKWTKTEIARLIQIIFRPTLIIVGTVGNCLTIYIMRRTSLKQLSTCFYMVVLALADSTIYLYNGLSLEIYLQGTNNQSRFCQESNTVYN